MGLWVCFCQFAGERRSVTDVSTGRGERKTLTRVLRAAARTDSRRSVLPLAVILDDSVEVWEDHVRDQVYRIEVFDYYSERAKMQVDNVQQWPSGPQLEMAAEVILRLRKEMFVEIDKLRAFFDHATLTGALDMDQAGSLEGAYTNMVPPPPWVSRLLPRITAQVRRQWQEKAAAAAVVQRPPPPRDPRLSLMQARQQQQRQLPPPAAPAVAATPANDAVFATLWTKNLQTSSRLRQGTASEQMERPAPQAGALRRPQTAPQAENPQLEVDDSRQVLRPAVPRTEEHAVVKLSQFAQREGLHLTYESEAPLPPSSEWRVRVRLAGRGSISGKGLSEEDAREHAAQRALEEESKSGGVGRGDRNARDDSGDRQPRQRSRSRERGSKRRSPSAGHSRSPRSHNEPRRELPRDEITRYNVQAYFSDYFPKHKVRFKETVLQPEGKGGMAKVRLQLGDYDVIGEGMQCNWARKDAMLKILRLHGVEVNMAG